MFCCLWWTWFWCTFLFLFLSEEFQYLNCTIYKYGEEQQQWKYFWYSTNNWRNQKSTNEIKLELNQAKIEMKSEINQVKEAVNPRWIYPSTILLATAIQKLEAIVEQLKVRVEEKFPHRRCSWLIKWNVNNEGNINYLQKLEIETVVCYSQSEGNFLMTQQFKLASILE